MRNRRAVLASTMLSMVAGVVFPAVLAGQYRPHTLADLGSVRPVAAMLAGTGPAAIAPAPPATPASPTVVRWYHGLLFLGAMAALSPVDEPARDRVQSARSGSTDDLAAAVRHVGQPEVYATVALGTVATGLISGNSKITRAGARISAGLALGGVIVSGLKAGVGRQRPFAGEEQYIFHPFSKTDAWPSGHTMTAFALATGVSDEVHSLPVTIGMYTLATGVAWSRMNDNKHWLTDVLSGAVIGIGSAKLMNGRWRVFGISTPRILLEPGHAGMAWQTSF